MIGRRTQSRLASVSGVFTRSVLEAKWLRFFNLLEIDVEYEPERFPDGVSKAGYLPDFFIHKSIYLEIKPSFDVFRSEQKKLFGFVRQSRRSLLVAIGKPPGDTVIVLGTKKDGTVGKMVVTSGFTWGRWSGEFEALRERTLANTANDISHNSGDMATWLARMMERSNF